MPSQTAKKKYPAQLVIVTTDAVADRIRREAAEQGVSIAEVARGYLEAGMAVADLEAEKDAAKDAARGIPADYPTTIHIQPDTGATRRAELAPSRHAVTI